MLTRSICFFYLHLILSCLVTPYHLGKTCDEHVAYASSRHCRYCSDPLTPDNIDPENMIPAFESICSSSACLEKRERACTEMLACGHACLGIRDELQHMPCLEAECIDKAKQSGDEKMKDIKCTKDDLCQICWVEELGSAPLLQLTSCPHIFHQHCVHEKLLKRWPGVRITFAFGECSLCKVPMTHPSTQFRAIRTPIDELYRSICQKAMARLAIEKMEKDQKLIDPQSRYYNQPLKYALDCFAYYNCYKVSQDEKDIYRSRGLNHFFNFDLPLRLLLFPFSVPTSILVVVVTVNRMLKRRIGHPKSLYASM